MSPLPRDRRERRQAALRPRRLVHARGRCRRRRNSRSRSSRPGHSFEQRRRRSDGSGGPCIEGCMEQHGTALQEQPGAAGTARARAGRRQSRLTRVERSQPDLGVVVIVSDRGCADGEDDGAVFGDDLRPAVRALAARAVDLGQRTWNAACVVDLHQRRVHGRRENDAAVRRPGGAAMHAVTAQSSSDAPPWTGTFFSQPAATNPTHSPSGDETGSRRHGCRRSERP